MSLATLFLTSALLHAYVGWRIVPALLAWPSAWIVFSVLLVASAVLVPAGLLTRRLHSRRLREALAWACGLLMGLASSLLVLTVLRDAVLLVAALVGLAWPHPRAWQALVQASGLLVPVAGLLITLLGFVNARRTAAVVRVEVPIADLPAALEGFTIAQISDVHVGPTIKQPYVRAIVEAVNRVDADMVAITGDMVDGAVAELAGDVAPLAQLRSRHGSYFVTGNHEYYSGGPAWIAELRRLGLRVLLNEHVLLRHNGATLLVAGVTDSSAHHFDPAQRSDPQAALAGAGRQASVRVLLAHQPRSAAAAERAGFDLQLSGHTHGGQFWPWNLLVRLQQPFTAGLRRLGHLWVYTSRGTGYWGPPKRFGAPSEITLLRLVRQPA